MVSTRVFQVHQVASLCTDCSVSRSPDNRQYAAFTSSMLDCANCVGDVRRVSISLG
jgi:hypothetical protein